MRIFLTLLLLSAAPALAQSDQTPRQMLEGMGAAPDAETLRAAIAAAAAHPLGSERNPVRTSGPGGQRAYIARLRCADGRAPQVGQRVNAGVGAFGTIVDVYPLDCGNAAPGRFQLFIDMYHDDHSEMDVPPGFAADAGPKA